MAGYRGAGEGAVETRAANQEFRGGNLAEGVEKKVTWAEGGVRRLNFLLRGRSNC